MGYGNVKLEQIGKAMTQSDTIRAVEEAFEERERTLKLVRRSSDRPELINIRMNELANLRSLVFGAIQKEPQ